MWFSYKRRANGRVDLSAGLFFMGNRGATAATAIRRPSPANATKARWAEYGLSMADDFINPFEIYDD